MSNTFCRKWVYFCVEYHEFSCFSLRPPIKTFHLGFHPSVAYGDSIPFAVPGGCPRSFDLRPPPTAALAAPLLHLPPAAQRLAALQGSYEIATPVCALARNDRGVSKVGVIPRERSDRGREPLRCRWQIKQRRSGCSGRWGTKVERPRTSTGYRKRKSVILAKRSFAPPRGRQGGTDCHASVRTGSQ